MKRTLIRGLIADKGVAQVALQTGFAMGIEDLSLETDHPDRLSKTKTSCRSLWRLDQSFGFETDQVRREIYLTHHAVRAGQGRRLEICQDVNSGWRKGPETRHEKKK